MKKLLTLFATSLLALTGLNAQQQGVFKSTGSATLDQITGSLIFGSGKTLTATGNGTITATSAPASGITGVVVGANGGTGVANTGKTITLGGNVTTSGAFGLVLTLIGNASITLPTTGTLSTLAGTETLTNKSISGATNTLTAIPNTALGNSTITLGSSTLTLGSTTTTVAGLSLTAPALGTPTSGVLTNATGLPLTTGVTGTLPVANGGTGVTTSTGSGANVLSNSPTIVTPVIAQINDASGNETLKLASIASAVNEVTIENAATGNAVHVLATGSDASVGLHLAGKGASGYVNVQDSTDATKRILFNAAGGTTNTRTMLSSTQTVDRTISLPDATDTLVGRATTDTLTNKTLVAPALGTPASGIATNLTGLPLTTGVTGTLPVANGGTGVTTSTGSGANVLSTSPTLVTPILGTPTSATLTNATGLPISTGVSGLGTGVATFLATPSSANLAAALTDETGTGANVFATSPTLTTPTINTITSPAGNNLTLGLGTGGTALTLTSGTLAATFAGTVSYSGALKEGSDNVISSAGTALLFGNSATWTETRLGSTSASGIVTLYAGNAERMRIASTGAATFGTGSNTVEITPSAAGRVNIKKEAGSDAYLELAGNGNTVGSSSLVIGQSGGDLGVIYNRKNAALSFGTNGTERLSISAAGAATFAGAVSVSMANPEVAIRSASDAAAQRQYLTFGSPNYNRAQFQSVSAGTNDGSLELRTFNAGAQTLTQTWNKDGSSTFAGAVTVPSLFMSTDAQGSVLSSSGNTLFIDAAAGGMTVRPKAGSVFHVSNAAPVRFSAYTSGAATFDSAGNITSVSDARLKNITGTFTKGLAEIVKLTPKLYTWKPETGLVTDDINATLIAQDLIAAGLSEAVATYRTVPVMEDDVQSAEDIAAGKPVTQHAKLDANGKAVTKRVDANYSVSDRAVIAALVNAVKELKAEIDALKAAK